jgi:hypothetical protein
MRIIQHLLPVAFVATLLVSCRKDNDEPAVANYSKGIYIINEGSFMSNNGSVSYFDPETSTIMNGIFESANGRALGDVVQSFTVVNDSNGYIVVNGSGKMEFVDLATFKTIAEPISASYPRYFLQVTEHTGYLSNGNFQGHLYAVDLDTHRIVDTIKVGYGPEDMVMLNNSVFVANSGGWGLDSTISVVDIASNTVVSTFTVGKVPVDLLVDAEDHIWVYCKGYVTYDEYYEVIAETDARIMKIDPHTGNVLWQGKAGKAGDYVVTAPRFALSAHGEYIYYLRPDGVYSINVSDPEITGQPLIEGQFYGIAVNPDSGEIFLFESGFTGNGIMQIYDQQGMLLFWGYVGIAPNGAVFNL